MRANTGGAVRALRGAGIEKKNNTEAVPTVKYISRRARLKLLLFARLLCVCVRVRVVR